MSREAFAFLEALFPVQRDDFFIELRAFENGSVHRDWLRSADELLSAADRLRNKADVYFGVCARRGHGGRREDVAYISAYWVDLDCPLAEAGKRLAAFPLPPTAIISSGRGAHAYWVLDPPAVAICGLRGAAHHEGRTKGLAEQVGGDSAWDLPRVLRVPGTINHKNGAPVELIEFHPERRYHPAAFDEWAVEVSPAAPVEFSDNGVDAEAVLARVKSGLSTETVVRITDGHLDGEDRSVRDYGVISDLVRVGLSDDEIRAIFQHHPVGEKYRERGNGDRYLALTIGKARTPTANGHGEPITPFVSSLDPLGIDDDDNNLTPVRAEDFIAQVDTDGGDDYLLDGLIPAGTVTLLVSLPKVGKSRFARQLCREMETGGELCGRAVAQGVSLYLALEESPKDVARHLERLGAKETLIHAQPMRMTEQTVELIKAWVQAYALKLIVVDTLNRFWIVESAADRRQTDAALTPLIDIAHTLGVTILILHHLRKSPGEDGTDIAESNDIVAAADQVIYLRRVRGDRGRRTLQCPGIGRYPPQPDLALEFDGDGLFVGLGELEIVQSNESDQAILEAVVDWMTIKELVGATGWSDATMRRRVSLLVEAGELETMGGGTSKNDPVKYRRLLSSPSNLKGESDDNNPQGLREKDGDEAG